MNFGEAINGYLAQIGCTAKELAAAAGVSEAQVSRWRSGKQTPSADQAALLAAGIAALWPDADEKGVRADPFSCGKHGGFQARHQELQFPFRRVESARLRAGKGALL